MPWPPRPRRPHARQRPAVLPAARRRVSAPAALGCAGRTASESARANTGSRAAARRPRTASCAAQNTAALGGSLCQPRSAPARRRSRTLGRTRRGACLLACVRACSSVLRDEVGRRWVTVRRWRGRALLLCAAPARQPPRARQRLGCQHSCCNITSIPGKNPINAGGASTVFSFCFCKDSSIEFLGRTSTGILSFVEIERLARWHRQITVKTPPNNGHIF